jgi:predicted dehydrogenase
MKQVIINQGNICVKDIPSPTIEKGKIMVKVENSAISSGTELNGVKSSGLPLWKRALNDPQKAMQFAVKTFQNGLSDTRNTIKNVLQSDMPIGYSNAGIVIGVGEGIHNVKIGDRVACAGAQCAYHAEIVSIPKNLFVKIPTEVSMEEASTVALGSIALQGVRRAEPTLGEFFVVIGLGILGQLTVQILKANGCVVAGIDPDLQRLRLAVDNGLNYPIDQDSVSTLLKLSDGIGVDGVIITAATSSEKVISDSFKMCRKKGRVILVGSVPLNINRNDIYVKELDFKISTSYGPGRYDTKYEEEGLTYPIGYVRWNETNNMRAYLQLINEKKINIKSLVSSVLPIEEAVEAYENLRSASPPLLTLFKYASNPSTVDNQIFYNDSFITGSVGDKVRVALIGAGNYAKNTHLPNLKKISESAVLYAVCSRTGHNANEIAKRHNAVYATTSYESILADKNIDAVIITTRHDQHANITLQALRAGKHVLVEKPLALSANELMEIKLFFSANPKGPLLMTGFNRRFSPHILECFKNIMNRTNPMVISYVMNAGYIMAESWVHGEEGGGRNIGEACHIYDLFTFLTQSKCVSITANSINPKTGYYFINDNFASTFSFEDGSIANLIYSAMGNNNYPKESMKIFFDGKIIILDNYQISELITKRRHRKKTKLIEKGQLELLTAFITAVKTKGSWPIPLWQQLQSAEMSFAVEEQIGGER